MDSVGNGKGPAILGRSVCGSQALLAACFPALDISLSTVLNMLVEEVSAAKDREARLLRKVGKLATQIQTLQERIENLRLKTKLLQLRQILCQPGNPFQI